MAMAMASSPTYFLCISFLLYLLPSSVNSQAYTNISLGSSLTAQDGSSFWPSPSGDFAFGFQQIGNGGFLLAIWFNKIHEKTVVWSANDGNLAAGGSKVILTSSGQLVLNDPQGTGIGDPIYSGTGASYAAMLDDGNFVLKSETGVSYWQSFDNPSDTILPSQTLSGGTTLVSRYSETNFSNGRFLLQMQTDGSLVLSTTDFPFTSSNAAYWATDTVGKGFQVVFNLSGSIYLTARNGTIINSLSSDTPSTRDFYQRAVVDFDGVFRQYVYPKTANASNGAWPNSWSSLSNSVPSDICKSIRADTGGGACGFNSYCSLGIDQRRVCLCPRGYNFFDPADEMRGCKPDFLPQICDGSSSEVENFELYDMQNTDWPLSDYDHLSPVSEGWCRTACLDDCFCAVAIFRNGDCWKKRIPLSNGAIDSSIGGKALIKIRIGNSSLPQFPTDSSKKKEDNKTLLVVVSALLSGSAFVNVVLFAASFLFILRLKKRSKILLQAHPTLPGMNMRIFSYKELEEATNGFKEELGSGAYATVYKGVVELDEKTIVAVKLLKAAVGKGDQEFKAEVSSIGRTNHKNLTQLLGFCNEGQHRLLVYEYMKNGSLANYLFEYSSRPNWFERIGIALGTARALCYLHEECGTQIIHCDIKPQNILLDHSYKARISDFGLAKLLRKDQTRTMTGIRGTKGYVAPEWFRNMPVTTKVDVYSYGVLLLEIVCCRKNFEAEVEDEDKMVLSDWAYHCLKQNKVEVLVENDEEAMNDMKRVEKLVMIAIWCIQEEPSMRPTMKKVLQMLEGAVDVAIPPDPCSLISSI